jgi:molybdate transport system substrate-binding protein
MKATHLLLGASLALAIVSPAYAQGFKGPKVVDAKPGDIRLFVTAAIREPLDAVMEKAQAAAGKPLVVEYGSARGNLKDEILKGEDFEIAILLPDVNEQLFAAGKIGPKTFEIARVPVAIGLRGDATIDVSTPDALKAAMLAAKSIKYAPTGAALMTVKNVLAKLNIADKIHDSSMLHEEVPLAAGEYEINLYPLSEIIPNKKLKNLGPVIAQLQVPAIIQAVIGKNANDVKAARAVIKFLQGPAINEALRADGMEKSTLGGTLK